MTFSEFARRINWRLIVVHFAATSFIILAVMQFMFLNDLNFIELINKYGPGEWIKYAVKEEDFSARIGYFTVWINLSGFIGLLLAFIMSLILTIKNKALWINALSVFIIAFFLRRFGFFDNKVVSGIFFSPGNFVSHFGVQYKFITNGVILTLAGLFIFFSRWTNRFIFCDHKRTQILHEQ